MSTAGLSSRQRYRTQVRADIKLLAWKQISRAGVSALSLNAIAKTIGMSGPALYRYFASRDELLTELIRDTYRSLADTMRLAFDRGDGCIELAHAVRQWALPNPQRYFLLYGTPVPGYHAPADTTEIADEVMAILVATFARANLDAAGPTPFDIHLEDHREWASGHTDVAASTLHAALSFWTRLHGVLSLELAGQLAGMHFDPSLLLAEEVGAIAARGQDGPLRD